MGNSIDCHVVVIGGGGTGGALCHDLVQRGMHVTLFERGELTSGSTGRHHGLLHSGARYAVSEPEVARECITENNILSRITTGVIEKNYGLFVGSSQQEGLYADQLFDACVKAEIPVRKISRNKLFQMEPALHPEIRHALLVPDATMDAWRLPLQFFATAKHGGAQIYPFHSVIALETKNRRVEGVVTRDLAMGKKLFTPCDMVINAAGAWAGKIAALGGVELSVTPGQGSIVAVKGRLVNMVINRLGFPGDGDIIVPQRQLSIIGTTNRISHGPDDSEADETEVEALINSASQLIPSCAKSPVHAAWAAARPLIGNPSEEVQNLRRDILCVDHAEHDGLEGMITITGGKASTLRLMAERAVDLLCRKMGYHVPCMTDQIPLLPHLSYYRI